MRLLLAEDELDLSRALTALLAHGGYSVDAVFDGEQALSYLRSGDYDGAILDIMMPRMDGIAVLKALRAEGMRVPVLILTAKNEVDDCVEGLDSGADDYLAKPFVAKELLARVRAMTRRQTDIAMPKLEFGNLTLDRAASELSTSQGSFTLSNKEFQVMEMLMLNPGARVATERFLSKIWGYDRAVEVNVVWTNISFLRKKLQALGATVRINASRGMGYALEETAGAQSGDSR